MELAAVSFRSVCSRMPMPMAPSSASSTSTSLFPAASARRPPSRRRTSMAVRAASSASGKKPPMPPINPRDPFLSALVSAAASAGEGLDPLVIAPSPDHDTPSYFHLFDSPKLMAAPAPAGAKHVYAVEASEMSEYARRLISGNPSLGERITPVIDVFDPRLLVSLPMFHTLDFTSLKEEELYEIDIPLNFVASAGTRVHGLACWFDVLFNGSSVQRWLSTAPGSPTTHWYQLRCVLAQPLYIMADQEITGRLHMVAHSAQSYTIHLTMSAKMWGVGAEQGGILQTSSGKFDLKGCLNHSPMCLLKICSHINS